MTELRTADYVVDVIDYWGENVAGELLLSFGFEPVEDDRLNPECYRIWRRAMANDTESASRTVFHPEEPHRARSTPGLTVRD